MAAERLSVVVTRRLPAAVETRMKELFDVELNESDAEAARAQVSDMCERLLANTVIENYDIEIVA